MVKLMAKKMEKPITIVLEKETITFTRDMEVCVFCGKKLDPEGEMIIKKDKNGKRIEVPLYDYFLKDNGEKTYYTLCDDHCGNVTQCERCGELFDYDDVTELEPIKRRENVYYQNISVCGECLPKTLSEGTWRIY